MKIIIISIFTILLWGILAQPSLAVITNPEAENLTVNISTQSYTLSDLTSLNVKELGQKRGKKLNFREKIAFFVFKRQLKKARKNGRSSSEIAQALNKPERKKEREGLGIILGLFLGLLGVLIAYIAFKDAVKGAWTGILLRIGIVLLIIYFSIG